MRKPAYQRQTIPRDEALVRQMVPAIRDATLKLYQICTCSSRERGEIRPASATDEEYFLALADLFRCYRWLAGVADTDNLESKERYGRSTMEALREGIEVVERIIPFTEPRSSHPWIRESVRDAMNFGMQALTNCVRDAPSVQCIIWPDFFEAIGSLIILEEDKLLNYVCAVIMNCLTDDRLHQIVDRGYAARIFERISVFEAREDSLVAFDAVFDLSSHLLQCSLVAERDYDLLPLTARASILDMLNTSFTTHATGEPFQESVIPTFWFGKLAEEFKNNCTCLLRLREHTPIPDEECDLVLKALNLLGNITASDQLRRSFCTDKALLDEVIGIFVAVDETGRRGENLFTPITKMVNIKPQELVTPSRGLKSQLLRLLANLVYENPEFEQRARETNIFTRLKDNTTIDYRNPYVQQWAILTIRNLHFSGLLEEVRREQEAALFQQSTTQPGLAHSVDGDIMGERKWQGSLAPHRMRGFQHSETVEALDLHTSFSEPRSRPGPSTNSHVKQHGSSRREHKSTKGQRRPSKSTKADQETQTLSPPPPPPPPPPLSANPLEEQDSCSA
ncbi:putative Ataxin-10 [Hypsibius exemplaris]|uniref:Ataxin-10 n=1 Tax=Hypsibius exemplaris TaxID=2072580 RepID=A0A1W0WUU0_HYPEX|nr:putative Ataxin-10 [Hypsibius exemplaris]